MAAKFDWKYCQKSFVLALLMLGAAAALKWFSQQYVSEQEQLLLQQKIRSQQAQNELQQIQDKSAALDNFEQTFIQLEQNGLLSVKERINWVDSIEAAKTALKLPYVEYTVAPQQPFSDPAIPLVISQISVQASPVTLTAGLLHEGDLFRLFNWIDQQVPGRVYFSQCELTREEGELEYRPDRGNLTAKCTLKWLSISNTPAAPAAETVPAM